ncbi:MAG: hypothetical protein KF746_23215 [Chitinophagaceae bacterium]|nr:hypothetical protein [Chitinophagaceae bacterium]
MKPVNILCSIMVALFWVVTGIKALPAGDTTYSISVCADVPDNSRPGKVFFRGEPGHVFIILERTDSNTLFRERFIWGFYPKKAITCVLFRKVRGRLVDNSNKQYDVSVTRMLNIAEYRFLVNKALELSKKKYHLNRYNCYHYALELFNSLQAAPVLPVSRVRFPFPFGKGGSPGCLYRDLQLMVARRSFKDLAIRFVQAQAPANDTGKNFTVKSNQ